MEREAPVLVSHKRTVLSVEPEAIREPSGENAMVHTTPVWPFRMKRQLPVVTSHRRIVLSSELEASCDPVGRNAMDVTASE